MCSRLGEAHGGRRNKVVPIYKADGTNVDLCRKELEGNMKNANRYVLSAKRRLTYQVKHNMFHARLSVPGRNAPI